MAIIAVMAIWPIWIFACPSIAAPTPQALFQANNETQKGFLWSSIGLAVLTAFVQGLVSALTFMTESSNYWTFRFRLAKIEHWWWTLVSFMLLTSLVLIILAFLSGNTSESVSILALSTTTFLAIVRYMIPAWRSRHYIYNRWLAWSGASRTTITQDVSAFCGNEKQWQLLCRQVDLSDVKSTPSDWYGWHLWPVRGLPQDPTDILKKVNSKDSALLPRDDNARLQFLYDNGVAAPRTVSLRWGTEQGFRKRVSRATSSMPAGLLWSRPFTNDGYAGEGLCLAMGVLGRNKGLDPKDLVFKMTRGISSSMENDSTWSPRPSKVLRSYYQDTMDKQYHGLGVEYVAAAVELALLFMDVPNRAASAWLTAGMEHQSIKVNRTMIKYSTNKAELKAHYESSYVSMIMSLNNMLQIMETRSGNQSHVNRPDVLCTGLLLKARGEPEPKWWNSSELVDVRRSEIRCLSGDDAWKDPMSKLLGLSQWPAGFENQDSVWGDDTAAKKSTVEHGLTSARTDGDLLLHEEKEPLNGFKAPKKVLSDESDTIENPTLPRFDSGGATIADPDSNS